MTVQELKEKVFAGEDITKEEALFLLNADLEEISKAALSTAKAAIVQKIVSSVHRQAVTRQGRNVIHWYLPIRSWKVQKRMQKRAHFVLQSLLQVNVSVKKRLTVSVKV